MPLNSHSCALLNSQVSTMFVPLAREGWLQKLVATKLHPFGVWKVCISYAQKNTFHRLRAHISYLNVPSIFIV